MIFDKEKGDVLQEYDAHSFEIWYTSLSARDSNLIYTASDDSAFKCFDKRVPSMHVFANTKQHTAGVTFVKQMKELGEHALVTGSYDCTVSVWDERKIGRQPLESVETGGKSVWDIQVNKDNGLLGIASVYDGYLFARKDADSENVVESLEFSQYEGHGSICYAFEWIEGGATSEGDGQSQQLVLTSSFYDSTL